MKTFDGDAYGFLLAYAKEQRGKPFCAEQVTVAAAIEGLSPPDLRKWGALYTRARKEGFIARSPTPFSRDFGNGSLTFGWVST